MDYDPDTIFGGFLVPGRAGPAARLETAAGHDPAAAAELPAAAPVRAWDGPEAPAHVPRAGCWQGARQGGQPKSQARPGRAQLN